MSMRNAIAVMVAIQLTGCATNSHPGQSAPPSLLAGPGVTVFAAGDIADCRKQAPSSTMAARSAEFVATELAADAGAVVLALGDNVYQSGTAAEFADCYGPTWGRFKSRTWPVPGNHEYYSKDALGYYDYFGAQAGPQQRGYYSIEVGQWHVMSLNSNLKGDAQQAQLDWLRADLAAHPTHCALAYWHHPQYSSGGHGNNDQMRAAWAMLAEAGTELILSGHDHDYERFSPVDALGKRDVAKGMRQFVVGTGGAELSPLAFARAGSETVNNATYGVLKLQLKPAGYEWEFISVAGEPFHDAGSAACH
ncbi:hypothetical protein RCH09_002458 [Actimicrobium sp. GrIS 1.19]|uniref:metallophosphoesterase family protein n=1 Tax=Actimicrobium sp. GrIS 1.19 TaxID=3071708 RepID=UPI002E090A32|nr:hypothetical protein [Actimicrobium sp. GrIS 1.19]